MKRIFKKGQKNLALPYSRNSIIVDIENIIGRCVDWEYSKGKIIFPINQFNTDEYWNVRKLTRFLFL